MWLCETLRHLIETVYCQGRVCRPLDWSLLLSTGQILIRFFIVCFRQPWRCRTHTLWTANQFLILKYKSTENQRSKLSIIWFHRPPVIFLNIKEETGNTRQTKFFARNFMKVTCINIPPQYYTKLKCCTSFGLTTNK